MKATPPPGEKIYLAFSASPRLRVRFQVLPYSD